MSPAHIIFHLGLAIVHWPWDGTARRAAEEQSNQETVTQSKMQHNNVPFEIEQQIVQCMAMLTTTHTCSQQIEPVDVMQKGDISDSQGDTSLEASSKASCSAEDAVNATSPSV